MKKLAEVLELNEDGTAKVTLYKHEKCSGCGLCSKHMHPGSMLDVENTISVSPGDMIRLELKKKFSFMEYFMFYIMAPLLFFIIFITGIIVSPESIVAMVIAFLSLAVTIPSSILYRKRYRPNYDASIIGRA